MARAVAGIPPRAATLAAVAAVALTHALLSWGMPGPTIMDNELGYVANARVIAGLDSTPVHPVFTPTNYAGYSLLLVPFYLLRLPPEAVYQGALVVNTALALGVMGLCYLLARRLTGCDHPRALVAGATVALSPSVLLHGSFAWAENLLFVLAALLILSAHRLIAAPSPPWVVLFAATAGALPFTHPRTLPVAGLAVLFLLAAAARRRLPAALVAVGTGIVVAAVLAGRAFHAWLLPRIYTQETVDGFNEGRLSLYLETLIDPGRLAESATAAAGSVWYLGVATLCLAPAGVILLALGWAGRGPLAAAGAPGRWSAALALLCTLAAIGVSGASLQDAGGRLDYMFYGRYAELWIPVCLAVAIGAALTLPWRRVAAAWSGGIAIVLAAGGVVLAANGAGAFDEGPLGGAAVVGALGPAWTAFGDAGYRFPLAFAAATAGALAAIVLGAVRRSAAALVVAAAFLGWSWAAQERYVEPQSAAVQDLASLHEVDGLREADALSYDRAALSGASPAVLSATLYQFHLPGIGFRLFDSAAGEQPEHALVIAPRGWPDAERLGARAVATEPGADQALWVLPESPLRDALSP